MKKTLPLIAIIAFIAFASFALLKETERTKQVKIDLPALKAMEYIADTAKMAKWVQPFSKQQTAFKNDIIIDGNDTLNILKLSGLDLEFRRSNPKGSLNFSISVQADKDSVHQSHLLLSYSSQKWKSLFGTGQLEADAEASLDSLKSFLNNPEKLYGYAIHGALVEDSSFLFASKNIHRSKFAEESKALYDMLIEEAEKRDAGYNGVRIFHFQDGSDSSRTIYAGIGVTKRIETRDDEKVGYRMMPYQKKLLVIDFYGPYRDVPKAYRALENFRVDNRMITMAIPFHKYMDSGYGFTEDKLLKLKVCYPVF